MITRVFDVSHQRECWYFVYFKRINSALIAAFLFIVVFSVVYCFFYRYVNVEPAIEIENTWTPKFSRVEVIIFDNCCIILQRIIGFHRMLVIEYEDEEIESLITTGRSSDRRYKKLNSDAKFKKDLSKVMLLIRSVSNVKDLAMFRQLHYEVLKYNLSGISSVRIGYESKYRLIFKEFDNGIRIKLIEINEHYGNK